MKHSIFIGSSTEGLDEAKKVQRYFEKKFETILWNDHEKNVFRLGKSNLKSLLRAANLYDFAIILFTPDDTTISRDKEKISARDNLIFEQGLFLGRMGEEHSFIMKEQSVDILSDYSGITISEFIDGDEESIVNACERVEFAINQIIKRSEIRLLPSTSLAIGYFENFLKKIDQHLINRDKVRIDEEMVSYSDYEFIIYIPENISELERANIERLTNNYKQVIIKTPPRDYPFYILGNIDESDKLTFYDVPTTLLSSRKAIRKLMKTNFYGRDEDKLKLEQREIRNFEMTIRHMINEEYGENNKLFKIVREL